MKFAGTFRAILPPRGDQLVLSTNWRPDRRKNAVNIMTIDNDKATAVVSNFKPKPPSTCPIDWSGDLKSTLFKAIVMPTTRAQKT